jgi:predicted enzyme related to lactoylglutathione lyase
MTERTSYAPGTPSWVDLGTPDIDAAVAFYGGLFGWRIEEGPPEAGGYRMCMLGDKPVAGMGPLTGDGQPSAWSTYVSVADADATAKAVDAAGGMTFVPPMDVLTVGRMAVFADPTGAAISVWQPRDHIGAGLVNEPGTFCWNELVVRDAAAATPFYEQVFGWKAVDSGMEGMTYTLFDNGGEQIAGMLQMDDSFPPQVPNHWMVYFSVDDCDAAVEKVTSLGGKVMMPASDSPVGRMAACLDSTGAAFSVIKLAG